MFTDNIFKLLFQPDLKNRDLLKQFYTTLKSNYAKREIDKKQNASNKKTYNTINNLLNSEQSWENAYQIEQLLIDIQNPKNIEIEFNRRLVDAKRFFTAEHYLFFQNQYENCDTIGRKILLGRLVIDLQWFFETRHTRRLHSTIIRIRYGFSFILALTFFLFPIFFLKIFFSYILDNFQLESLIYNSITSGVVGSYFSLLLNLNKKVRTATISDLKAIQGWVFIISRGAIGAGAGLFLFYFFQTELANLLLSNSLIPKFTSNDSFTLSIVSYQKKSLLTLWCFIAGFSEKLVPSIIHKAENEIIKPKPSDFL